MGFSPKQEAWAKAPKQGDNVYMVSGLKPRAIQSEQFNQSNSTRVRFWGRIMPKWNMNNLILKTNLSKDGRCHESTNLIIRELSPDRTARA